MLSPEQKRAAPILQRHYSHILNGRKLADWEIKAELKNLRRKEAKGDLDDSQERLYSAIFKV